MRKLTAVSLVSLALATGASAEIYKWIDAQGNVHYGEHPPADVEHQAVEPPRGPSDESVSKSRERRQGRVGQQQRPDELRREDAVTAEDEKAAQEDREAATQRLCTRARENLDVLMQERPVYGLDGEGERVFFDDEARAREIAEMKKIVEEYCR